MIRPVFLFWYAVGLLLMLTIGVPDMLAFSNGLFLLFFAAYALHIEARLGEPPSRRYARALAVGAVTFAVEAIGVATGYPFGAYAYTSVLGWSWFGVPLSIACAWTGVVTLAVMLSDRGGRSKGYRAFAAGAWTVLFDLVLDPVAYARGFWTWSAGSGYYGVPVTNFIAWFLISALLSLLYPARGAIRFTKIDWEARRLMQLMLLMFGLLAVKSGMFLPLLAAMAGMLWLEGAKRIDTRKQESAV